MPRKKSSDDEQQEQPKPRQQAAVISGGKLKRLMAAKRSTKKDMYELMGTLGQSIKDAVDNDHLDRKMFNWICQLDSMEPEKIAAHLDNFNYYLDVSGINKRAESVMRMKLDNTDDDAGEDDDTNVHTLPAAGRA